MLSMTNVSRRTLPGCALLLACGLVAAAQGPNATGRGESVLTVCDVLAKADEYNGKTIRVRGEVITGRHGYSLRCSNAPPRLRELWHPFPLEISLQPAVSAESSKTIKRMDTLLCFLHESTAKELGVQILTTYTGTIRTLRASPPAYPPGLTPPRVGIGHLAGFGVELEYVSVSDLVIKDINRTEDGSRETDSTK